MTALKAFPLVLFFAATAQAGALSEANGQYQLSAQNSPYCPTGSTMEITVDASETQITLQYTGTPNFPATTLGVSLNEVVEIPVFPAGHTDQRAILRDDGTVIVQEKGMFEFSWKDSES